MSARARVASSSSASTMARALSSAARASPISAVSVVLASSVARTVAPGGEPACPARLGADGRRVKLLPQALLARPRRPEFARHPLELPVAFAGEVALARGLRLRPVEAGHQPLDLRAPLGDQRRGI